MKLIYGEHSSGKSSKALELIKNKDRVFYLSLDQDRSLSDVLSRSFQNTTYHYINNCFLIDLEFAIIGRIGKPMYDTVVIDSLNYIKVADDINHEFNLKHIISGLEYLHHTYDLDIIATFNTLRNIDRMKGDIKSVFVGKNDWELIETKRRKEKKVGVLKITTKDGTIEMPRSTLSLF
jgi:hypothetical protein